MKQDTDKNLKSEVIRFTGERRDSRFQVVIMKRKADKGFLVSIYK